jgi:hypothetical protein
MTETTVNYNVDTVDSVATEIDSTVEDLHQRYQVNSVNTLKKWCELADIRWKKTFTPFEVTKLDHVYHCIKEQGMTYSEYEQLKDPQIPHPKQSQGYYTHQAPSDGNQVANIVKQRYQSTINALATPIAQAFWQELDYAVLGKLVAIASSEERESTLIEKMVTPFFQGETELFLPPVYPLSYQETSELG